MLEFQKLTVKLVDARLPFAGSCLSDLTDTSCIKPALTFESGAKVIKKLIKSANIASKSKMYYLYTPHRKK